MLGVKVINPGLLMTIQDLGRYKFQQFGVPVSGTMDEFSYRILNLLLDNDMDAGALEVTMMGPTLEFYEDSIIAITGGNLNPKVNGIKVDMWRTVFINKGDILSFSGAKEGCRTYIGFKGGIDVSKVMGSKSTYMKGSIGGINGKSLGKEEVIPIYPIGSSSFKNRKIPEKYIPKYSKNMEIRVVMGPQDDYFTESGIETFLSSEYKITNDCDRMGFRLEGEEIELIDGSDIISDGISFGAIQVPGHGKPIIMMADRQTTGGYSKIANVISTDLSILAQGKPGDFIRFRKISIKEAHILLREREDLYKEIAECLDKQNQYSVKSEKNYIIKLNGIKYDVKVEELEI